MGKKFFLLYQTSHGCCEISIKPQKELLHIPMLLEYNSQNGFYMKCGDAIFVGERLLLIIRNRNLLANT